MRPSKLLAVTWSLEHGGAVDVPSPEGGRGLLRRAYPEAARVAAHTMVAGVNRYGRAAMAKVDDTEVAELQDQTKEVSMRKLIVVELLSLDGIMESPEEWAFSYSNDEMEEANASGMAASDAMLLGRVTYQEFASYWPYQNSADQPYTDYLNNTPKFVVSTSLEEPLEWQNSTLIRGNVAEEITELKRRPGKDITTIGSGTLVRSLLREGLLDELRLMVHPIVLGSGKRLFEEGGDRKPLELVDSKTFSTGVVSLTYQPDREEVEG